MFASLFLNMFAKEGGGEVSSEMASFCEWDVFTFDDQKAKSSQARGRLRCAFGVILAGPPARGRKVSQLHSSQSQFHACYSIQRAKPPEPRNGQTGAHENAPRRVRQETAAKEDTVAWPCCRRCCATAAASSTAITHPFPLWRRLRGTCWFGTGVRCVYMPAPSRSSKRQFLPILLARHWRSCTTMHATTPSCSCTLPRTRALSPRT